MIRMAAMMMKSLTWHKSWPVEEALLWTEAKAAEPVDGARAGLRVWKILPLSDNFKKILPFSDNFKKILSLSDNFNDRGGIGCIWEGVNKATRMRRTCGDFLWRWRWWITHICRQLQKSLHQHLRLVVHTLEGKHHRIPCDWDVTVWDID